MIKAVIFDMDGVITDTEKLLVKYWVQAAEEYGFPMKPHHALAIRSLAGKFCEPQLKEWFGEECDYKTVRTRRMELMQAHLAEHGLEKKKGIDELLDYLSQSGIAAAVATATDIQRATAYLTEIGIFDRFDKVISASMVENGKPCPDIYRYAAAQLGLDPSECIALEDSPNGIKSASSAGCKAVMIPDLTQPDEEILPLLYAKCDSALDVIELIKNISKE